MKINILGSGFAALTAVKKIRKKLPNATIQVIASSNQFIYYPSLIWIPSVSANLRACKLGRTWKPTIMASEADANSTSFSVI